ncbi:MAG: acetyltransferase [Flavobacteriales bacterium]
MLIIGTGGMAKDIIGSLSGDPSRHDLKFYNDKDGNSLFFNKYPVLRSHEEVKHLFETEDTSFVCAIANPLMRKRLTDQFKALGGQLKSYIFTEPKFISEFVKIGRGTVVQFNTIISSNTEVGEGVFFNCACIIGHDVTIGDYVSFGPGAKILGNVQIGDFSYIGTNAVIMPGVKIGAKVRVGVGKIVTEDLPDGTKFI